MEMMVLEKNLRNFYLFFEFYQKTRINDLTEFINIIIVTRDILNEI